MMNIQSIRGKDNYKSINIVAFTYGTNNPPELAQKVKAAMNKGPLLLTVNIVGDKKQLSLAALKEDEEFKNTIRASYSKLNINFDYAYEEAQLERFNPWLKFSPTIYTIFMAGYLNPVASMGGPARSSLSGAEILKGLKGSSLLFPEDDFGGAAEDFGTALESRAEQAMNLGFDLRQLGKAENSFFLDLKSVFQCISGDYQKPVMVETREELAKLKRATILVAMVNGICLPRPRAWKFANCISRICN